MRSAGGSPGKNTEALIWDLLLSPEKKTEHMTWICDTGRVRAPRLAVSGTLPAAMWLTVSQFGKVRDSQRVQHWEDWLQMTDI